jgi:hypothetical protein
MMNDWKKISFDRFSPILGIEKTLELLSSIEKVYLIDNNEDAIMIIDYLIDVTNDNIQSGISLLEEYNNLNREWRDLDKIRLVYNIFNFLSVILIIIYKDNFSNTLYYGLLALLGIPLLHESFINIIRGKTNGKKSNNQK